MSIDPLAESYVYNGSYNFAENRVIDGNELEGLEWIPINPIFTTSSPITSSPLLGASDAVKLTTEITTKVSEVGGKTESHHVIPRALKNNDVVKAARKEGFKFEGVENKVPVEKFSRASGEGQHGSHPKYNSAIKEKLDAGPSDGIKPIEFVRNVVNEVKEQIKSNPKTKINDLLRITTTTTTESTGVKKPDLPRRTAPEKKASTSKIPFVI